MTEKEILDLPTGVVSFYMDSVDPRTPGILSCFRFAKLTVLWLTLLQCCLDRQSSWYSITQQVLKTVFSQLGARPRDMKAKSFAKRN